MTEMDDRVEVRVVSRLLGVSIGTRRPMLGIMGRARIGQLDRIDSVCRRRNWTGVAWLDSMTPRWLGERGMVKR